MSVITAVGDVMLGDAPDVFGFGVRSQLRRMDRGELASRIRSLLGSADCHFANLECVLTDVGESAWIMDRCEMRGTPEDAGFLADIGWNVISVANNHIFQHGYDAYSDTVVRLERVGITPVGEVGDGSAKFVARKFEGWEAGFLAFSLRPEQYRPAHEAPYALAPDKSMVLEAIREARGSFKGPIICSLHWGHELMDVVSREQQQLARQIIDAGVSLVIGHHPHVLQGVERYRGGLIAYSLGNFIFNHQTEASARSAILKAELDGMVVVDWHITPVMIGADGFPRVASTAEDACIRRNVKRLSQALEAGDLPPESEVCSQQRAYYRKYRTQARQRVLQNWRRFHPYFFLYSILRAILRRIGLVRNP